MPAFEGLPPGPSGGAAGVSFLVTTLTPQIAQASEDLDQRFGVDELASGRRRSDLYDPKEVRDATVLTVLWWQYLAVSRDAGAEHHRRPGDNWAAKAEFYKAQLDELLGRCVVRWRGDDGRTSASRFSLRLTR